MIRKPSRVAFTHLGLSGKLDDLDLTIQQIELEPEVPCFLPAGVPHDALAGIADERQRDRGVDDGPLGAERVRRRQILPRGLEELVFLVIVYPLIVWVCWRAVLWIVRGFVSERAR